MQDLRLIGVHEDGVHLLLADDDGNRYQVPLDESLRAAARRDRPRLGQLQIEVEGGLRPRDVQAMIRAGLSAEEVAERAGWAVEKVHRYEVPILAEREHVAGLARQVRLRSRGASGGAATLGARVAERLRSRELDPEATQWDSRRTDRGVWTVVVLFNAGGRQREAAWDFDPLARTVVARDDEARWLSEDEDIAPPGPIPAPHLAALTGPAQVYDVEAEGGIASRRRGRPTESAESAESAGAAGAAGAAEAAKPVDLMEAIRERSAARGRRQRGRGADVPGIEDAPEGALPLENLTRGPTRDEVPPSAHGHPRDDPRAARSADAAGPGAPSAAVRRRRRGASSMATTVGSSGAAPGPATGSAGSAAETQPLPQSDDKGQQPTGPDDGDLPGRAREGVDAPVYDDPPADEVTTSRARPRPSTPSAPSRRPSTRRSGRPSVPSWDDIMFGRKGD
ncbi:MAG TPA: septation protein SepH [Intrasporangium sp.]|nr:septation protein SepH [Intrasporangium sp.]